MFKHYFVNDTYSNDDGYYFVSFNHFAVIKDIALYC